MERKLIVSENLGAQLKEFRTSHQIKAKDIAELLNKSPAYISKLEKGQIQQIDKSEFEKITNFITKSNNGYEIFCELIAEKADNEELENNIMLLNFDVLERKFPISKELVDEIINRMHRLNVSAEELIDEINKNADLDDKFLSDHKIDPNTIEKNIWIPYKEADSLERTHSFIFLNYTVEKLEKLLNGKTTKCEYMFPFSIIYHLLKIEQRMNIDILNESIIERCKTEAENILLKYKFYSLSVESRCIKNNISEQEFQKSISKFDLENRKLISEMLAAISFLSKYDVSYTNSKIEMIVKNFKTIDPSFVLAFMAIPLEKIKELNPSIKRKLLDDVNILIDKYANLKVEKDDIERY